MKQFLGTMAYGMSSLGEAVVDLGRSLFSPPRIPTEEELWRMTHNETTFHPLRQLSAKAYPIEFVNGTRCLLVEQTPEKKIYMIDNAYNRACLRMNVIYEFLGIAMPPKPVSQGVKL
jgi:hypothetical protein